MKGNNLYIMVAMVAVALVGVTIGLQVVILLDRPASGVPGNAATANAEIALAAPSTGAGSNTGSNAGVDASITFMQPTPAPPTVVVVVTATPEPTDTEAETTEADAADSQSAGSAPIEPADATAVVDDAVATTVATLAASASTSTSTATETATAAQAPPTETTVPVAADVDFSIGYMADRNACSLVAEIMEQVLETEFDHSVRLVPFADSDTMFLNMAEPQADPARMIQFSPCYIDPADRSYLLTYNTTIALIGGVYREVDGNKYYTASHTGLVPNLEFRDPCVLKFLRTLNFQELDPNTASAQQWIASNAATVAEWTQCN